MTQAQAAAWRKLADYYNKLATDRADEGASVQLACLVLAHFCVHQWSGDYGGPTEEMAALAGTTIGESLSQKFVAELTKAEA